MQGTRIEIFKSKRITLSSWYRSPCRERELKFTGGATSLDSCVSLPTQGARIEITIISILLCLVTYRSPRRERELKLMMIIKAWLSILSLPTRGTRIEIRWYWRSWRSGWIAPHAGGENWNLSTAFVTLVNQIALHAGSENWNKMLLRLQS